MGIGGAGMSGLALLLDQIGCKVSGCDAVKTSYVKHLEERNIPVIIGHEAKHIDEFMPNVLVYSSAIPNDHPEILKAWQQGIQVSRRAEVLSQIFNVRRGVGVAGTHGKTTTSSMISLIAEEAGADPTIAIGGDVLQIGTNAKLGQSDYMVAELDESDRSFVYFHPEISVITNIDWDHRDHYMTFKAVTDAFAEFLSNSKREGKIIMCMEDGGIRRLREEYDVKGTIETYGWGRTWNWGAAEVSHHEGGGVGYRLFHDGKDLGLVELSVSGEHNVLNSLAAYAASHEMGIAHEAILKGLKSFRGAKRRLQKMGEVNGIMIYDDYGHHPNEISATLSTVRRIFPDRRIVAVFQPHRFSRTQAHFGEFCKVFDVVDQLVLTEIYAASEKPIPGVSGESLAQGMRQVSETPVTYFQTIDAMVKGLDDILQPGDVLLTLGAGTITRVGPAWLEGGKDA